MTYYSISLHLDWSSKPAVQLNILAPPAENTVYVPAKSRGFPTVVGVPSAPRPMLGWERKRDIILNIHALGLELRAGFATLKAELDGLSYSLYY